jgi:hypothetical protein
LCKGTKAGRQEVSFICLNCDFFPTVIAGETRNLNLNLENPVNLVKIVVPTILFVAKVAIFLRVWQLIIGFV